MKKVLCLLLIFAMSLCLIPAYASSESSEKGLPINNPHNTDPLGPDEDGFWTSGLYEAEIPGYARMIELLNQDYTMPYPIYIQEPEDYPPYANIGTLVTEALDVGLLRLNVFREMAGLYPLEYSVSNNTQAQYAAFIGKVNRFISHHPSQPEGFSDALYQACAWACARSNLAGPGYQMLRAIDAYMTDHQSQINLNTVGHRRNILKPSLKYIGIGQVYDYNALFINDSSYGVLSTQYDIIAYPAANSYMPLNQIFWEAKSPWHIVFNNRFFSQPNIDNLTVRIEKNGEVIWENSGELDYNHQTLTGPYMIINTTSYGTGGSCLIFRPDIVAYTPGEYIVYIDGLYNRDNEPIDFKYKVTMFDPDVDFTCPINYIPGDIDQDNIITVVDALIVMRYAMGITDLNTVSCPYIGDVDEDGVLSATDALVILRMAMQL